MSKLKKLIEKIDGYLLEDKETGHIFRMSDQFEDSYDAQGVKTGKNCVIHNGPDEMIGIGINNGPYESEWQSYVDMTVLVLDGAIEYEFDGGRKKYVGKYEQIQVKSGVRFKWKITRNMRCIFKFKK
jgi:uncharacterized cupin superfamily protein